MKNISLLFALSTFTLALGSMAGCEEEPTGAPCNNDDDCDGADEICTDDVCQAAQCEDNVDCDLSENGDAIAKGDLDNGNTDCGDQDLVTIVQFDGTEVCILGEDDAVGCGAGLSAADAEAPGGATVSVCVTGDGVCDLGSCG